MMAENNKTKDLIENEFDLSENGKEFETPSNSLCDLSESDRDFINLILTRDLESVDKRKVSQILVKLGFEPIVSEEDYVFDEDKFYEELEAKRNAESEESTEKSKKKKFKIKALPAAIITLILTACACLTPCYLKYEDIMDSHKAEITTLTNQLNMAKEDNETLLKGKDEYISYLELLMQKSNMYYGGEIKLSLVRDMNTNHLMVEPIDATKLDDYVIDKYTRSWGDKREFEYRELDRKLVYMGPEK